MEGHYATENKVGSLLTLAANQHSARTSNIPHALAATAMRR